ncbi:Bgr_08870 family protein [Bartonella sp. MR63HLJHH]|uniref:Bgr_08870 family protein n=1 Tax=Bartonella sp. MR63HLJHH TaxID=3243558 RepID=UPI0035D0120F
MTKTKKLDMELPKEGRFISSEFPILRENLTKIDQAMMEVEVKVEGKAPSKHTHSISDVTDLEAALKGKMAADKTFSFADLSDIEGAQDVANNYVLYKASNNHFTFGSAVSLLGAHQHKTEDIVGLDDFRAKINEDLTAYGRLQQANEWKNYNTFNRKVTMGDDLEILGNLSSDFFSRPKRKVVTRLSANESTLKGPLKVDGDLVYTKSEIDALLDALNNSMPVGTVIYYPALTVPKGWLKANGALISRSDYAQLFAVIGTTYGAGDGKTTFRLPDLRGEFLRGVDDKRNIDPNRTIGSQQGDAIRNITGELNFDAKAKVASGAFKYGGVSNSSNTSSGSSSTIKFDASRSVPTANENRPRNIALLALIRY